MIYGDGACGYSLTEFDTYVRHGVPVIAVVGNDAGWTQIAREQVPMFNSSVACDLQVGQRSHPDERVDIGALIAQAPFNRLSVNLFEQFS